jgi:ABC-2 type transport system ATP-binding protein
VAADALAADLVLGLDGLGKDFGATVALEALSCRVERGEIVGLLGPNGAGKTTTMKLVLGMLRPSRGSATFMGLDCTHDAHEVKRRLGYSPDEPVFYDFLNGKETIDFVLNVRGLPLALLLALAHDPALLLLDEPTNGLDPPTAARVRALLRERADAGAAVVVSTHLLDMADQLCDRVLVVHHGRLIAEGTTEAVRVQAGVDAGASLEDAFLALVR